MTPSNAIPADLPDRPARVYIPELDVLRGLAAVLMITNHLAVRILSPEQQAEGLLGALTFSGSFAPVLFFFVTGLGSGVQSQSKSKQARWGTVLYKAGILLIADQLMHWSVGRAFGLDFLGFIGLSMLVLEFIRTQQRALILCWGGILGISILRYLVAPVLLKLAGAFQEVAIVRWILGSGEVTGISYPLSPWMVYPLLGFIIGVVTKRNWTRIQQTRWRVIASLSGLALLIGCLSGFLAARGAILFRWGTVSLNFYLASFAAVLVGLAVALMLCWTPKLKLLPTAIALPGIASLAVVPIHYFLLRSFANGQPQAFDAVNALQFCLRLLLLTAVTFLLGRLVHHWSRSLAQVKQPTVWVYGLMATIVGLAVLTIATGSETAFFPWIPRTSAQVLLCLLLSLPSPRRPTVATAAG